MKALSLQFKIIKHLKNEDDSRVRDYLIHIRKEYPNMDDCNIDINILKQAANFLRSKGWKLHLDEDHSDRPSRYIRKSS